MDLTKFKFASIEFYSHTYREFDIPDNINIEKSRFVIFDIKEDDFYWQEIGIFTTEDLGEKEESKPNDDEKKQLEQKFIHAKVRIGCKYSLLTMFRD